MKTIIEQVEFDFDDLLEEAIEQTIIKGLNEDKEELISDYNKDTFYSMQNDYRMYGALFGMNLRKEFKNIFEKIINEEKEN